MEITGSRWKAAALLAVSLIFEGVDVLMIARGNPDRFGAIGGLVLFGSSGVLGLWRLVRPQRLLLDDEGFTLFGAGNRLPGKVRWQNVDEFFVWRVPKVGGMVGIRFKPGVRKETFLSKVNRLIGADEALPKGWPHSTQEMVDLLNASRLKAEERAEAAPGDASA